MQHKVLLLQSGGVRTCVYVYARTCTISLCQMAAGASRKEICIKDPKVAKTNIQAI